MHDLNHAIEEPLPPPSGPVPDEMTLTAALMLLLLEDEAEVERMLAARRTETLQAAST